MKQLAYLLCLMAFCVPVSAGSIYRAGQSSFAGYSWLHGEISAGYQFSSQKMGTKREDQVTSALKGWDVRALWAPLSWFAIGAEMTHFEDENLRAAMVSPYETHRVAGLVKLTLSPNTSPRVYVLAGYGRTSHKLNYDHSIDPLALHKWPSFEKKTIPYWMVGLGIEINVWKAVFVGAEGNLLHHQTTQLRRLYKTDSKTETALRVRAGVRF